MTQGGRGFYLPIRILSYLRFLSSLRILVPYTNTPAMTATLVPMMLAPAQGSRVTITINPPMTIAPARMPPTARPQSARRDSLSISPFSNSVVLR